MIESRGIRRSGVFCSLTECPFVAAGSCPLPKLPAVVPKTRESGFRALGTLFWTTTFTETFSSPAVMVALVLPEDLARLNASAEQGQNGWLKLVLPPHIHTEREQLLPMHSTPQSPILVLARANLSKTSSTKSAI